MLFALYFSTFVLGIMFLITYELFEFSIEVCQLLHKIVGTFQLITIYYMLLQTGSGLRLVPHKLVNGNIQFEGYDKDN